MVGQSEGAFGNDLTNVMTPDSQEEIARRFVSFQKKNRFNSESYSTLVINKRHICSESAARR